MPTKKKTSKASSPSFVLLSDLHAHAWSAFAKGDGRNNTRLRRSLDVLAASLQQARELNVPWVFGGDIVHTAGYTLNVVLSELVGVLGEYGDVTKLAVWGNHDARGVGGKITLEQTVLATILKAVPRFHVLDPSVLRLYTDPATGLTFSGAGYQPQPALLEYGEKADVGIYHQTVRGTKAPNGFVLKEGIPLEEMQERHRLSVVGHVHHWQYLGNDQGVLVPGSPEHQNFGDTGEHGWWIISLTKGTPNALMVPGGSPEFRIVETPAGVKKDGNFYRVERILAGESLPEGAIAVAPVPTAIENRDILKGARGEQAIAAWLKAEPPDTSLGVERYQAVGASLLKPDEVGNLRPIRLKRIHLQNFCSYKEQSIDVTPGTWLVIGRGRDFPSNGAGKSTLFEAVFWALFGRTTKGLTGDEVIRWGAADCSVLLEFDDGFTVTRTRGSSSKLVAGGSDWAIEGKSVNELTDKLAAHLGITPELYQALGYFSQEKLLLFASATDGERKDMLGDLIGLSAYQKASSAAQSRCVDLGVQLQRIAALKEAAETQLFAEEQRRDTIGKQTLTWAYDREEREQAVRSSIVSFDANLTAAREQMMVSARQQLSASLTTRLTQARCDLMAVTTGGPKPKTNTPQELLDFQLTHSQAVQDVKVLCSRISENEKQRAAAQKKLDSTKLYLAQGMCPSCGQSVSPDHLSRCLAPIEGELAVIEQEIAKLTSEQKPALDRAANLQLAVNEVSKGVKAAQVLEQQEAAQRIATQNVAALERESAEVENTAAWHVDKTLRETRLDFEKRVTAIMCERNPYQVEQEGTEQRIKEATETIETHAAARVLLQQEIAVLDYWRRGFSKQGIQSLLVDQVAGLFNNVRGSIFPALTQGVYDVQFSTLSQTKAGEVRERTEFVIYERGQPIPYAALSGGQRRRIDVGVMLTLVKAVSTWMQVPGMLGILVLDEVFGFLDGSGAEGLMEALREMQSQITSIFVVSHDPQLQALFPEVICVAQDSSGTSKVVTGDEGG